METVRFRLSLSLGKFKLSETQKVFKSEIQFFLRNSALTEVVSTVRSVRSTEVKILPYRPTKDRLIKCLLYCKQEQFNSFNVTGLY